MQDKTMILMRRMGVKTEKVRKGLFGLELRLSLDGECADTEVLCVARKDGTDAHVVKVDDKGRFANGQVPSADELLYAVRCASFYFNMTIPAGIDYQNFHWSFKVGGELKVIKPEIFMLKFRGAVNTDEPLAVATFEQWLGTIPATTLHDNVIVDVLGVVSLQDMDEGKRYVDMPYRLEQSKEVSEKFISSTLAKAFADFFGAEDVVSMSVTSFHAFSADREANLAADEAHDAAIRKDAAEIAKLQHDLEKARLNNETAKIEARKAEEESKREEEMKRREAERIKRDNDARREEELCQKKHELELAELEAQKAKLKGGDVSSAFAAFETISNVLENAVQGSGSGSFVDVLKCVNRGESGLRLLALTRDKKRAGGVTLEKSAPSFQTRGFSFTTKKTPSLHHGDSLSSTIINERRSGYLMIMNISERNEIIPLLPNADFPDVRIACGERVLVGDDASAYIPNIWENASSGTDHLVAMVSDVPLLSAPLPPLGEALSASAVSELISKLETLDADAWAADIISFTILP